MKVIVHFPAIGDPPDAAFWYDETGHLAENVVRPGPSVLVAKAKVAGVSPGDFDDWCDLAPEYSTPIGEWQSYDTVDVDELLATLDGING